MTKFLTFYCLMPKEKLLILKLYEILFVKRLKKKVKMQNFSNIIINSTKKFRTLRNQRLETRKTYLIIKVVAKEKRKRRKT